MNTSRVGSSRPRVLTWFLAVGSWAGMWGSDRYGGEVDGVLAVLTPARLRSTHAHMHFTASCHHLSQFPKDTHTRTHPRKFSRTSSSPCCYRWSWVYNWYSSSPSSTTTVMQWIVFLPQIRMFKPSPLVPQNVTVFGDRAFKGVTRVKWVTRVRP